jgi:antitoxin HigA-1
MTNGEYVSVSSKATPTMLRLTITIKDKTMAIPNTAKREIRPTHPGEMLREDFMPDYDLNTTSMANALGVSRQTINEILRERRAISPAMALRLSRLFSNSPEFWLNVQHSWDLWDSEQRYSKELSQIHPLNAA